MRRYPCLILIALITGILAATTLQLFAADLLYDNGSVNRTGGATISYEIAADDFMFGSFVLLTSVSVDIMEGPHQTGLEWDGTVEWWILEDNDGRPGGVFKSGIGHNIKKEYVGEPPMPYDVADLKVDFDLGEEIRIESNKLYWLGLHFQNGYDDNNSFVMWRYTTGVKNNDYSFCGEIVDGAPSFDGLCASSYCYSCRDHDLSFRLYGEYTESGYADTSTRDRVRDRQLHGILAEYCRVEYSYTQLPALVCNFPWNLQLEMNDEPGNHGGPPPFAFSRYASDKIGARYIQDLNRAVVRLFRMGGTKESFQNSLDQTMKVFEKVPTGSHFNEKRKASLIGSLKGYKETNFKLARSLVESLNAMELDLATPLLKKVKIKTGSQSSADLSGIAWLIFNNVNKAGMVKLDIREDIILPKDRQEYISGWPFGSYHFEFDGKLEENGYVEISLFWGGLYFPGDPKELRMFEIDGQSWKDITATVDTRRQIIIGKTNKLSNYVIMIPACLNCKAVR